MKSICITTLSLFFSCFSNAESNWKIAESTDALEKLKKVNPASLQYVNPEDEESDYDIRIGILGTLSEKDIGSLLGFDASRSSSIKLNATRDTITDKPQNNYDIGIGWDFNLWKFHDSDNPKTTAMIFGTDLKYKKDEEKDIESFGLNVDFFPINLFHANSLRSIFSKDKDRAKYFQGLIFNLSYEDTIDAPDLEDGSSGEGSNTRFWLSETFKVYPLYRHHGERVEIAYSGEFGYDLSSSGIFDNDDKTWVNNTLSLNYYLSCEKTFAIGWDYFNGERRRKNKEDDQKSSISLKFRWPPSEKSKKDCQKKYR